MKSPTRFLPPEWHPQDAILLTWPHNDSAWSELLPRVERTYLDLTTLISRYQNVVIQLHDSIDIKNLIAQLQSEGANLSRCHFTRSNSNDTWARDHGPITVIEGDKPVCLDFQFNGWGGKFESALDNQLNQTLHDRAILNRLETRNWVLEGGSIESDGHGTLMTTKACVLNQNRNGHRDLTELENHFKEWFGCNQIIWLEHGELEGDDTDAHIDTLARFAPNNTIIFQGCQNSNDSHFAPLKAMARQLETQVNAHGTPYRLIELPFPSAKYANDGRRLPATYANFLICNDQVIVPTYQDAEDKNALSAIANAFPDHIVHGVDALPLIEEHGSIHCITMQLPVGSVNFNADFDHDPSLSG